MSFLDNLFTTGVASALKTPTGQIDVSTTTPALDDVLQVISTSPLRAGWAPGGGGGAGALQTVSVSPSDSPFTMAAGRLYIVQYTEGQVLKFPAGQANVGKSIWVHFVSGSPGVSLDAVDVTDAIYVLSKGVVTIPNMPQIGAGGGLFRFTSFFDTNLAPFAFWLMERQVENVTRRFIDVDWALTDPLPDHTVTDEFGPNEVRTATTSGALFADGGIPSRHDLILVQWETDPEASGVFEVIEPGDESTNWVLRLRYRDGGDGIDRLVHGAADVYRAKSNGLVNGCKLFAQNEAGGYIKEVPQPLRFHPTPISANADVVPGRAYFVDVSGGDVTLTIRDVGGGERYEGMRIGIKVISGFATGNVILAGEGGLSFETTIDNWPDNPITVGQNRGMYVEWLCMPSTNIFYIVAFVLGSEPA